MAVSGDVVRAAGGVISRRDERGEIEVLLVYRAGGQRDWSFPKGKVEPGETDEACALREVREETNLRCTLGWELPSVSYHDRRGRAKVVRYWAMTAVKGDAEPRNEIAAVRWLGIEAALSLLTYQRDRELLTAFAAQASPIPT
jgi:8-oxo-dGTP pyrophosphatase MutT (NUDIX family)